MLKTDGTAANPALQRGGLQPKHALVLLMLAAAAWGINGWSERQQAPLRARMEVGQKYFDSGQYAAAIEEWRQAVVLNPQKADAWQQLGEAYVRIGDWKNAYDALQHVEKLAPDQAGLYSSLAVCAAQLKDNRAARRYAERELARDAQAREALRVMVAVLEREGEEEARLTCLQRLAKLEPDSVSTLILLGDSLIGLSRYEEARPVVERLLQLDPKLGSAYSMRGVLQFESGSNPQSLAAARRDLQTALRIDPQDSVSRLYLAKVLLRAREPKKAIPHLETIGRSPTANPAYLFELGNAYRQLGQRDRARIWLRRFEEIQAHNNRITVLRQRYANNPQSFETVLQLALALMDAPQPVGAEKNLSLARQLRPGDARLKAAEARLERLYQRHLQAGRNALRSGNLHDANWYIVKASMLRPRDARTQDAAQQLAAATPANGASNAASSTARPTPSAFTN